MQLCHRHRRISLILARRTPADDRVHRRPPPPLLLRHPDPGKYGFHVHTIAIIGTSLAVSNPLAWKNKKHLTNVGPIRHCEPLHCHLPGVATVARRIVARRLRIDVHDNDDDDDNDDNA